MGFLDDLKRRAESVRQQQDTDGAERQRRTAATEAACRTVMAYLNTLATQLDVLQPVSPARFELDRRHVFERLRMTDFFADGRVAEQDGQPLYEHLLLHWQLKTGATLNLVKDFPNEIEQLEARLHQAAVPMQAETVRHPDTGKLVEMRYEVLADFRASVRVEPQHEQARLQFVLSNLDALETLTGWVAAKDVTEPLLDELARWLVGQPHGFLQALQDLRRHAP